MALDRAKRLLGRKLAAIARIVLRQAVNCLHRAEPLPLLLLAQLLLFELLVAHTSAAVKAAADRMQPLAEYQCLQAKKSLNPPSGRTPTAATNPRAVYRAC